MPLSLMVRRMTAPGRENLDLEADRSHAGSGRVADAHVQAACG